MPPNPFAPPRTARLEVAVRSPRKPPGVWAAQALLLLIGWFIVEDLAKSLVQKLGPRPSTWPGLTFWIVLELLILAWMAAAMIGAQFRQGFARWMGLAFVLAVSGLLFYFSLFVDALANPEEAAFDDGVAAVSLVVGLAVGWWFAFAAKAKAWFRVGPANRGSDDIA